MRAPLDYLGLNYYSPWLVQHLRDPTDPDCAPDVEVRGRWATAPGMNEKTANGWDIYPDGFYQILVRMARETGSLPIEITENGAAYNMRPDTRGDIHDGARVAYLRSHLLALAQAIRSGVPVRAYHCWSLMDNFEWAEGFTQRFGLVYVDVAGDQRRLVKDSGHWYANVAATNRIT